MKIGLYEKPTNENIYNYRGLYRTNELIDFYEHSTPTLHKSIDYFFSISNEGLYLDFTEKNIAKLLILYKTLKSIGWQGELIAFTDNLNTIITKEFEFIGYDICANSMYYSPIGDNLLENYDLDNVFFAEMSVELFNYFKTNINNNGLFSSSSVAITFSNYCNNINQKFQHCIESENDWRPFAIYSLKDCTGDGSSVF